MIPPRPLFDHYPRLRGAIPHVMLADLPTPVQRLTTLESALGDPSARLYIKRDDITAPRYGGNKVRKLEFLLGRAVQEKYTATITYGGVGSNHALATALYARQLGLHPISILSDQPNAHSVRRNLLMGHHVGADLVFTPEFRQMPQETTRQMARYRATHDRFPCIIPAGGTSPLGILGYVNAAFELKAQIEAGVLPEPDVIYTAVGTLGTAIGLTVGLMAAGLRSQLMAVRVTAFYYASMEKARLFFGNTIHLLRQADPSFPLLAFPANQFQFRDEFYGKCYGLYTEESVDAVRLLNETEAIHLEGTYTGKAISALLADTRAGQLRDKTALFWNTYNSADYRAEIESLDYHALPQPLHRYFEEPVQPLDE